jgi:hypothetical protein
MATTHPSFVPTPIGGVFDRLPRCFAFCCAALAGIVFDLEFTNSLPLVPLYLLSRNLHNQAIEKSAVVL